MPMPSGANTNQAGTMFANKKEYTADEIVKNFIAVNEELKKAGFTYYQLPSASMMQIWENGKLVPYFPDMANMSYPATVGPKGSITDYKNPNFDEALMRKYTDAKSLSDQLQQKISSSVRGAMGSAADPSKVDVAGIVAGIYSSQNTGGRGITLSQNDPQKKASSLKISNVLKQFNVPFNKYNKPPSIDTDSLSVEAVRNNDANNIVALRKVWGAQPAAADTGLDPKSDEFQYLSTKKSIDAAEKSTAGAYKATVAENQAALKTAWADFKAVNDELKAKGYSYLEASEGVYGTALNPSDPTVYTGSIKRIDGPKGNLNSLYARYEDGRYLNPEADPSSPQYDKSLSDLNTKAGREGGIWSLTGASSGIASAQYFKDIQDRLVAKGVDLVKLEQDNPYGVGIPGNNQVVTFGAKASTGQTNLPQTAGTQDPYDILGLSADAAKRIIGLPDKQRGGGAGGNLMQANAANPGAPATGLTIEQFISPIQAQTNAMNAGTWKPSDGYYFSSPNGVGFDPTGMMADNRITNPEKYKLATADADGIPDKDGYVRILGTQVGDNKWLKDNGYDYQDVFATGMPEVKGPKGAFNLGWTTDPAKKGDYQKDLEKLWAKAGVTFAGQTLEGQEWTNNATKILADPWNYPKNKPGLVDTSWLKPNGMTFEQALAAHAALVNTTTGEPKPGVTPAMLSKALVDLRLAGAFEGGGFGTAGLRIEDGMIISGGQLPNAQNSLPSPEWLKSMGYSPGYYKKPDPQGLGEEYDTQLGADGQIWTAVPPSVLAAQPALQSTVDTNINTAAIAVAAASATPATPAVQAAPTNPDYNPALVHPELNPTGSIQKQLELNAFFKSPNPDIQASLISELNPTGSLKKQADLNNYFASLPPAAPPAVPAAPAAATAAVNYSATLPQTPPTKAIGKNGELVGISPTKGGAITTAGITPGTTASPYAQTAVPTFTTRAPYTQPSPRQIP